MNPTLTIDFIANVARITQDMAQINRVVTGSMASVNSAVATAKRSIEALGVTLSLGAMVLFADRTLNAIARMKDLGQEAGTSASAMSKFEAPARKAGESLDQVATAMFRMSKAALEAKDPSSASAQALTAIGISASQLKGLKPDEMFELIARSLEKYGDGLSKNNVMQQLFGKSGKELNGVMHSIAEQSKLTATVTDEQAEAAKKLEEQMVELKMTGDKFWRSLVSDAVPGLTQVLKSFMEGAREAGLYEGAVRAVSEAFAQMKGLTLADDLKRVNDEISSIRKSQAAMAAWDPSTGMVARLEYEKALAAALVKRADLEHKIFLQDLSAQDQRANTGPKGSKPDPRFDPAALAAAKAATEAYKSLNAQLDKELANLTGVGALEAFLKKLEEDRFKGLSEKQRQTLIDQEKHIIRLQDEQKANEYLRQSIVAYYTELQKLRDVQAQLANDGTQRIDDMQFEISLLGKTSDEVAKLTALRQADLDLMRAAAQMSTADQDGIDAATARILSDTIKQNEELKKRIGIVSDLGAATKNALNFWTDLGDRAGTFFADLEMNGHKAFTDLRNMVKQLLADMIKLFVQRWVLQIAGVATGSATLTNAAASTGSNTLAGAAGSAALNYLGTSALGTAAYGAVGLGAGGVPAATGMIGTAASESVAINAAAGTYGTAMAGVYEALAAIPVWGWIAMAVIAIGAWIAGNHKGGPKFGGSAFGGVDSSGNFVDAGAVPGTDNGRLFTPDQMDSGLQKLVAATALTTAATITALGGKSGGFNFALGADNDPNGTAQSRVSALLTDALGHIIYSNLDQNMDDKAVPQALQLETERMMVAAIKASSDTLDPAIAAVFKDLDPLTASLDDLDAAVKKALDIKSVIDALKQLNLKGLDITALQAWQQGTETLDQTFQRVAGSIAQFDDAFMTDAQKLDAAQSFVTKTFGTLGIAIPASTQDFYDLVHGLDLSTKAGRDMFDTLMSVAPAFQSVQQATASMIQSIHQSLGTLVPGYTAGANQSTLHSAADQFRASHPWASAWSDNMLVQQLMTITDADLANYAAHDQPGLGLINTILGTYSNMQGSGGSSGGGGSSGAGAYSDSINLLAQQQAAAAAAAKDLAAALMQAKTGLGDYLNSLLLDKNLSPLSPLEQQAEAQRQFYADITAAKGGDLGAYGRLQGDSQTFLGLARSNYGSSSTYIDIFKQAFDAMASVSGTADYNTRMLSTQTNIYATLIQIRDRLDLNTGAVVDATTASADQVSGSIENSTVTLR